MVADGLLVLGKKFLAEFTAFVSGINVFGLDVSAEERNSTSDLLTQLSHQKSEAKRWEENYNNNTSNTHSNKKADNFIIQKHPLLSLPRESVS